MDSMYTTTVPSHGVAMLKVVGKQAKLQEVFEAEYAWINNFNLTQNSEVVSGQGRVTADAKCSGRAKAAWLGNRADNYIEFHDVYANLAGNYTLTLTYISAGNQQTTLTVNGADMLLKELKSKPLTPATTTVNLQLNKGNNIIRLSNASGWMPDIDKIQLDLNKFEKKTK